MRPLPYATEQSQCHLFDLGDYCTGAPPLPIPNREVKPLRADGTAVTGGRVGRRQIFIVFAEASAKENQNSIQKCLEFFCAQPLTLSPLLSFGLYPMTCCFLTCKHQNI